MDATFKDRAETIWGELAPNAREVLGQLYLQGPLYDGHIASKVGRDELRDRNLIERGFGFQWLTRKGVEVATAAPVGSNWFEGRWRKKQVAS